MGKRITGLIMVAVSVICTVLVILGVYNNIAHSGPMAGKITTYQPPFYAHGLYIIILGIAGAVCFLSGILVLADSRKR